MADAECLAVVHDSLIELGFNNFTIRLNDRRILSDIAAAVGATTVKEEMSVLVALDKLDKIGRDGVTAELDRMGFSGPCVDTLWATLEAQTTNELTLQHLEARLNERGREGVAVLRAVLSATADLGLDSTRIAIDPTLARGLDYYTGPVFETVVTEPKIGSISGGGRYDELIGMFGKEAIPAVGVSLGLERIIVAMEELGMLPTSSPSAEVFVTVFNESLRGYSAQAAALLRKAGISDELYLGDVSSRKAMNRQLKLANSAGFPFVVILGPDEQQQQLAVLKTMRTGEQQTIPLSELSVNVHASSGTASTT